MFRAKSCSAVEASQHAAAALLGAIVLALALLWPVEAPREAAPLDAPAPEFSATRALHWLNACGPLEPRPGGTATHTAFRERLVESLRELGLEVEVHEALGRGPSGRIALVRNVVARQFAGASEGSVLLSAHYDTVGCSPGAADDGAGCASLLEIARALAAGPPLAREVVYLFSDAEEAGLIGAEAFAANHRWAASVEVVVNLEARGHDGPSVVFQIGGGPESVTSLAQVDAPVRASSLAEFVYKLMPNDTDYSVFARRGVAGFNLAFLGGLWSYHTPRDDLGQLAPGSVQHQGEVALALTKELATRQFPVRAADAADERGVVFTDLVGTGLVYWPAWLGVVFAAAATLFAHARSRPVDRGALRAIVAAAPGVGAAFALAALLAWGEFALLALWLESPDAGARSPLVAHAALVFTCASAFLGVAGLTSSPHSFRGSWSSIGALLSTLALVTSLVLPELSFLALLPALAWCGLELLLRPQSSWRALLAVTAFAALSLALWIPVRAQFWLALSFRMPVVHALSAACVLALTWPALTLLSQRFLARGAAALLLLGASLLTVLAVTTPGEGAGVEWLNLRHVTDTEANTARFEASTFGARLPDEVARAAPWRAATTPPFNWMTLDPSMHVASAPPLERPAPALEVLHSAPADAGRRVRVRLRSLRGAPRLHLHLPDEVSIESVAWRGQRIAGGFDGVRTQLLFAFEDDGVEFELLDRAPSPSSVHVIDQDWAWTPEHLALIAARDPRTHLPRSDGDIVFIGARRELE